MPRSRGRFSWVLAGWLLCQFVGISAPILFAAKTAIEEVCLCPHAEEGAACPMHHGPDTTPAGHTLKSDCTPSDAAFLALIGGTGIIQQRFSLSVGDQISQHVPALPAQFSSILLTSDSPPPRA